MVIWYWTYSKGQLRWPEKKPTAITSWDTLSDLSYAASHRQDSTYHGLYYTSYGVLARMRNIKMGPP